MEKRRGGTGEGDVLVNGHGRRCDVVELGRARRGSSSWGLAKTAWSPRAGEHVGAEDGLGGGGKQGTWSETMLVGGRTGEVERWLARDRS